MKKKKKPRGWEGGGETRSRWKKSSKMRTFIQPHFSLSLFTLTYSHTVRGKNQKKGGGGAEKRKRQTEWTG